MAHALDTHVALITPKSLARNGNRSAKVVGLHKLTYAARTSMRLQEIERGLLRDWRESAEPEERCLIARTICGVAEQRRIVLRIPAPGRDGPLELKTYDLPSASILSAVESEGGEAMPASPASDAVLPQDAAQAAPHTKS